MQHNSNNNFTPYDEFLALRNQVEELVKSAKNKDLDEMKEKIEILEKEKRKISDENITLKRELIKLQDLLASHRRIPREDQSIPNIANKNRPNEDFFLTKETIKKEQRLSFADNGNTISIQTCAKPYRNGYNVAQNKQYSESEFPKGISNKKFCRGETIF